MFMLIASLCTVLHAGTGATCGGFAISDKYQTSFASQAECNDYVWDTFRAPIAHPDVETFIYHPDTLPNGARRGLVLRCTKAKNAT